MRLKHILLMGALLAAPITGAWAQTGTGITSPTIAGTNTIDTSIAGPGGQIQVSTVAQFRNATAFKAFVGLTGVQTYQALTSDSTLYWVGTAPTSWTITTPAKPFDGEIITVGSDTTLTNKLTITANTGQSMNTAVSSATLCTSAPCSIEFQYSTATTKWYELR